MGASVPFSGIEIISLGGICATMLGDDIAGIDATSGRDTTDAGRELLVN